MSKISDFDILNDEIGQNNNPSEIKRDSHRPKQFNPSFVTETVAKKTDGLYMIPIENLVPFKNKGDGDFSPWEEEDLKELANTMDSEGSYEPILVRQSPGNKFEILAGEHRVKASKLKGLKEIKAIVFRACSDEKAMDIFLLTNLQRRKTKISDSIYGWSMFAAAHPVVRSAKALEEITMGVTDLINSEKMPVTLTQYYRYVKMSNLTKELISALDNNKISIRVGCELARLNKTDQMLFMPYLPALSEAKLQELFKAINEQGLELNQQLIEDFIFQRKERKSNHDSRLRKGIKNIKQDITKRVNPKYYDKVDDIVKEALDLYFQTHPEFLLENKGTN